MPCGEACGGLSLLLHPRSATTCRAEGEQRPGPASGITTPALSRIEGGKANPSWTTVTQILAGPKSRPRRTRRRNPAREALAPAFARVGPSRRQTKRFQRSSDTPIWRA